MVSVVCNFIIETPFFYDVGLLIFKSARYVLIGSKRQENEMQRMVNICSISIKFHLFLLEFRWQHKLPLIREPRTNNTGKLGKHFFKGAFAGWQI